MCRSLCVFCVCCLLQVLMSQGLSDRTTERGVLWDGGGGGALKDSVPLGCLLCWPSPDAASSLQPLHPLSLSTASFHPHILHVCVLLYVTIQPQGPRGTELGAAAAKTPRGKSTQTISSLDKRAQTATRRVCARVRACVCLRTFVVLLISPELQLFTWGFFLFFS